jgi:hypothetical protein
MPIGVRLDHLELERWTRISFEPGGGASAWGTLRTVTLTRHELRVLAPSRVATEALRPTAGCRLDAA